MGLKNLSIKLKIKLPFPIIAAKNKALSLLEICYLQRNSGRRRNENIILPTTETIFFRNSIRSQLEEQTNTNTLTNKETRVKTLKEFKCCLVKFDTDKMHFEPISATTKSRDIGYEYF